MSARNWQELRERDFEKSTGVASKVNDMVRDLNSRIDDSTQRRQVDIKKLNISIGAAVTNIDPKFVTFAVDPDAVIIGRCRIPTAEGTTCEAVSTVDWMPEQGNRIRLRAISGVTVNTRYEITLVAYGK